jgi:hypothetical protein
MCRFCLSRHQPFHGELHIPPVIGNGRIFGIPVAGDLATGRREVVQGANATARSSSRT